MVLPTRTEGTIVEVPPQRLQRLLDPHDRSLHVRTMNTQLSSFQTTRVFKPALVALVFVSALAVLADVHAHGTEDPDNEKFFEEKVRPLLAEKCWSCHGDSPRPKGGLRLTSRSAVLEGGDSGLAVVAGRPEESPLIHAIRYIEEPKMPPASQLKESEIDILKHWVTTGLPWPSSAENTTPPASSTTTTHQGNSPHWAFQPIQTNPPPEVEYSAWIKSPVDRFILHKLEAQRYAPAPAADPRTLIRRATFDLTGLPPTPAEVEAFLADSSPNAFAKVIDRLLASNAYGQRWGRHWLDLVRYADARDLIQLPPESDFREAWRYRDWVVAAFNQDQPYNEFLRDQIAGDLVPTNVPGGLNADGLVATGMLAIADFVPGDVDKDQMVADYVNDQIDVVSRGFLGLSLACARCHDHKFDPISTEDYYALAGIFFSTRLIPSPVPGNTPLVRVPLLPAAEVENINRENTNRTLRISTLERDLAHAHEREFATYLKSTLIQQAGRYLVAAANHRALPQTENMPLARCATQNGLEEPLLASWVEYLNRVATQPSIACHPGLQAAAEGKLNGAALEQFATDLQTEINTLAHTQAAEANPLILQLRADDPQLVTNTEGNVTLWPNHALLAPDATPVEKEKGPSKAQVEINGHTKQVLRFDGSALLEVSRQTPTTGSLFAVFRTAEPATGGQRLVGFEDADSGKHGLGVMPTPEGGLHVILRNEGKSGDLIDPKPATGFEVIAITWGPGGTSLTRHGMTQNQNGIESISAVPSLSGLRIGGPGTGAAAKFRGDLAELRLYDRPLSHAEQQNVTQELEQRWFNPPNPDPVHQNTLANVHEELLSRRGPFWVSSEQRQALLPTETRDQLTALKDEYETLKKQPAREIPQAVVVQDGGPKDTRFEGFKDSPVFLRGNYKKPGKVVSRGFPKVLTTEPAPPIIEGSGRRQLAEWLTRPDHPLTARVMVNRIWQHHFGEALVRTPNDFGIRGEPPTHPELLDHLAAQFINSGWSVKAMHRLILLSATYQQSSSECDKQLAQADPENRLVGRMMHRRLDAESVRDSLLAVAGNLDFAPAQVAFLDLNVPRRTLYLSATRTGAATSDFGRLFDRADPGSIIPKRDQSIVAPQSLFFLNDPFVRQQAAALSARLAREESLNNLTRIQRLYAILFSRDPTPAEVDVGLSFLESANTDDAWARYCLIALASHEFIYVK